jgi:cytochrome c5
MITKAGLWIVATIAVASVSYAVTQNPSPPAPQTLPASQTAQDPGQVTLNRACTVCHTLSEVTKFKGYYGRDQWADVVRTMRADGAQLKDEEVAPLVDYLFKAYGRVDPPAVDGKKLLETSCTGCHDLDTATGTKRTKSDWEEVIGRMIGKGASVDDAQFPILVDYLTKTFGTQ